MPRIVHVSIMLTPILTANVKLPEKQSFCVQVIKYSRLGPLLSRAKYAWISPAVGITVVAQPAHQYMIPESVKYYGVVMAQENKNHHHLELYNKNLHIMP
jgi:hypothetical protein